MNKKKRNTLYRIATVIALTSSLLSIINFLFLKKASTFMNAYPIKNHYGNELAVYYLASTVIIATIAVALRKRPGQQSLLIWGVNMVAFSNEFATLKSEETVILISGLTLITVGIINSISGKINKKITARAL